MKNVLRVLLCLALSAFVIARGVAGSTESPTSTEEEPSGRQADAKILLYEANKATAAIIKSARADKDLDPKKAKNKPFWQSLQTVAKSLKTAGIGLAAKKDDFFKGIAEAREAEERMKVDWQLTDSKNKSVIENGKKLGHALATLRTEFSKQAQRKKSGGELTDKEKAQFEKIKAQQKDLVAKIKRLEGKAKKDKALEKGLAELRKQAERVMKEPVTLDAYIATLYLLDLQAGLIRGYSYYVDPDWRNDYLVLVDYTKAYDAWHSESETSVTYDWAVIDSSVDLHEGEDVDLNSDISDSEISSQATYVENGSFELSEAERNEVAIEENNADEVASPDESLGTASDEESEDASDDEADDEDGD